MNCTDCKWYSMFVNPDTGRKKPTEKGVCNFPLPWPTAWPAYAYSFNVAPPHKPLNRIWGYEAENCKTFAEKDKHDNLSPMPLL